jgi:triacylglycerol lipase
MNRTLTLLAFLGFGFWIAGTSPVRAEELSGRTPVVFAHGLGVPWQAYELLAGLKALFESRHHPFFIARTPIAGSIEERSEILKREINRLVPEGKLHLIGHSMGGLDARMALRDPQIAGRVLSLTTLATPHHGSAVADFVVGELKKGHWLDSRAVEFIDQLFGGNLQAAQELTTAHMDGKFNVEVTDDPGVRYFSLSFYIPPPAELHSTVPLLWLVHAINSAAGASQNDGMVSVESARWGHDLGTLAGDHYSETSPIPLIGGPAYLEIFGKVLKNLEKNVENN